MKASTHNTLRDSFYTRLDFYRLLEAGHTDLDKIGETLQVDVKILRRWQRSFDPGRGPFDAGAARKDSPGQREDILAALRTEALNGNVSAAKLLLSEYEERPVADEEILTVERASQLLREWHAQENATS